MIFISWFLFAVLTALLFPRPAIAQETNTIINSNPPGAMVTLEGEYQISATTPCLLPDNINGLYRLKASLPGYESWNGEIMIVPGQANRYNFSLSTKTRVKAALRSMFFPGWGQYYAEHKSRAFIFGAAALSLGVGTIIAENDFRQKKDDYERAKIDLQNAAGAEEIIRLRDLVIDKNREAYDAESTRNMLLIAAVGVYAYNVLDALIFFPERKLNYPGALSSNLPDIGANINDDRIEISLSASF